MPSRAWYVVAVLVAVGAIAAAVWLAVSRIGGMADGLVQVVVPGSADLMLDKPGTYTIFHERVSQAGGRLYTSESISGLRVTVRSGKTGNDVALRRTATSSQYNLGGRSGISAFAFDIDAPGTYRLTAAYDDGRQQPRTVLAVGTGFVGGLLSTIGLVLAVAFGGMAAGIVIAVVVLLKRRRVSGGMA
jgi:hypothetical protein